jgi:hypothetical protein
MRGRLGIPIVLAAVALFFLSIALPPSTSHAGLLPYRLTGGPLNRLYTVNPSIRADWYGPKMRAAVSSWTIPNEVSMTETTNWSASVLDYYAQYYGNTSWRGVTVPFLSNGTPAAPCVGCYPTSNWDYAEISLNHTYILPEDINTNKPRRTQNTAAHEFGHAIALSHSSNSHALLYAYISNYDLYGIYTPQLEDVYYAIIAY